MKTYKEKYNEINRTNTRVHKLTMQELSSLHQVLFNMFQDIDRVCREHDIVYMLTGGSALGAVRHKGFIPWDDDLDIAMPRKDYEIFKEVFESELGELYVLNAPNHSSKPLARFPKILKKGTVFAPEGMENDPRACVFIDLFVIENIPDNTILKYLKGFWCTILMFIAGGVYCFEQYRKNKSTNLSFRTVVGAVFSFLPLRIWYNFVDSACSCQNDKSKYLGIPTGRKHYFGEILERKAYLPCSSGVFEGKNISLPGDYDSCLRNLYGNYMEIPPEEKREGHYISIIKI